MPDTTKHYVGEVSEHAVIVNDAGQILLLQHNGGGKGAVSPRFHDPLYGKWHFPGGRMDRDDTPGEGLKREIFEETGLTGVELILPCHASRWGFKEPVKYSVAYLARVRGAAEVVLPDDEHAMAYRWFAPEEMAGLTFITETHKAVIASVLRWAKKLGVIG